MPKDISRFLDAPVPGQGLTQDPEVRQPWETPPQITDIKEARELIFRQMISPEKGPHLLEMIDQGIPVSKIAMMMAKQGFKDGLWTPDLVLMLIEPVAIMIIAVARKYGMSPVIINEDIQDAVETEINNIKALEEKVPEGLEEAAPMEEEVPSLLGGEM